MESEDWAALREHVKAEKELRKRRNKELTHSLLEPLKWPLRVFNNGVHYKVRDPFNKQVWHDVWPTTQKWCIHRKGGKIRHREYGHGIQSFIGKVSQPSYLRGEE